MLSAPPSTHLKSPTAIATRYDDIFGDVANFIVCWVIDRPRRVGQQLAVRDRHVAAVDGQRDAERRLERRFVEAGKRAPRVGRFELRHGVVPGLGLAQVEAAQLVVEDAAVLHVNRRSAPSAKRRRDREGGRLRVRVERDRPLSAPRRRCRSSPRGTRSRARAARPSSVGAATWTAIVSVPVEARMGEIDDERQVVVDGHDRRRQSLGEGRERRQHADGEGTGEVGVSFLPVYGKLDAGSVARGKKGSL